MAQVLRHVDDPLSGSRLQHKDNPALDIMAARDYVVKYLVDPPKYINDPSVFPLTAPTLSGLPPALIMVAQRDIIRDDGVEYAQRLTSEG